MEPILHLWRKLSFKFHPYAVTDELRQYSTNTDVERLEYSRVNARFLADLSTVASLLSVVVVYCGQTVRPRAKVTRLTAYRMSYFYYEKSTSTKINDLDLCLEVV